MKDKDESGLHLVLLPVEDKEESGLHVVLLPVDLSLFDTFCLFLTFDHRFCSKAFALC